MMNLSAQTDTSILAGSIEMTSYSETALQEREITVSHGILYRKKPVYEKIKRAFDVTSSLIALIMLAPLMLVVMVLIVIDDFGSPFYMQERVGKDGKIFKIYKFRSMYKKADKKLEEIRIRSVEQGLRGTSRQGRMQGRYLQDEERSPHHQDRSYHQKDLYRRASSAHQYP